jgi:hypothetical protein
MPWDDFARVGALPPGGAAVRGLSCGGTELPDDLRGAFTQAGIRLEEAPEPAALPDLILSRKPDLLVFGPAALGPDPAAAASGLLPARSPPAVLVVEERGAPEAAPRTTPFDEMVGSGQDALGAYLMLRATLRRRRPHVMTDVLTHGLLSLDQERFTLSLRGREARLTLLEFCILGAMLDAPRMVWNKVFLNRVVFGPAAQKPGRQFDTYMSRVRRGLREKLGTDPIEVEHRMGYALSPPVLGVPAIAGRA